MEEGEIQSTLQAYCAAAFPEWEAPEVAGLRQISTGWESDVYAFDLLHGAHGAEGARLTELLVLRIYPGQDAYEKSAREFDALVRLYRCGYPVPEALAMERDAPVFGKPFLLMRRAPGISMWAPMFNDTPARRALLSERFCALLAGLHRLDWRLFLDEPDSLPGPYRWVDAQLSEVRWYLDNYELGLFQPVMDWLEERRERVPCSRPAPVHWDFHPGNILLDQAGGTLVIDWTGFQVSDPRFDLAWTLLLMGSFEGPAVRQAILEGYQKHSGGAVEELEFFDVFACLRRLGGLWISLSAGADHAGMRPGAEEMMRRQFPSFRAIYNLLVERTGLRLAEVEKLLSADEHKNTEEM